MTNLTIFFLIVIAGFVLLWGVHRYERKRSSTLHDLARRMGLTFKEQADADLEEALKNFPLFSLGHARTIRNVLSGYRDNAYVMLFEYYYTDKQGQSLQNIMHTVLVLQSKYLYLPEFSLCPENVFHKLEAVIGRQDIDFDSHPDFSKYYVLRGPDEGAVRKIFTDEILKHLQSEKGLYIEGHEDRLLVYKKGPHMRREKIESLLREGFAVLRLFESSSTHM